MLEVLWLLTFMLSPSYQGTYNNPEVFDGNLKHLNIWTPKTYHIIATTFLGSYVGSEISGSSSLSF